MVEATLGIIAFIAVLLAGIYFAEVGYLSLEATEAATEPLWDATARRMHDFNDGTFTQRSEVEAAAAIAQTRQRGATQVFARSTAPALACRGSGVGLSYPVAPAVPVLVDQGGMACQASIDIDSPLFPRRFAEGGDGFFQASMQAISRPLHLSAAKAPGGFGMLVDDWAFASPNECTEHRAYGGGNPAYFGRVNVLYQRYGGSAGDAHLKLVEFVVRAPPVTVAGVAALQLSFRGEESLFTENLRVAYGRPDWPTTPYEGTPVVSYDVREPCFLGVACGVEP